MSDHFQARDVLRRLVSEAAAELDDEDAAWLLGRWRRFDRNLDAAAVDFHVHYGTPPPAVRFIPVPVEGPLGMRYR